jgi:hypothetical protein
MNKRRYWALWSCAGALILVATMLGACSDDSTNVIPPEGEDFSIEFRVVDVQGNPREGIQLTLFNDHDYLQGKNGNRAMVAVPFSLESNAEVRLYVNDAEGDTVRALVVGVLPAGVHQVVWNGRDNDGVRMNSGRYDVQMRVYAESGAVDYADSMGILLSNPDSDFYIATTDEDGQAILTDKRLFPQLYSLADMYSVDESSEIRGMFNVTSTMHAYFKDPDSGDTMWAILEVGPETTLVTQVWDPIKGQCFHEDQAANILGARDENRTALSPDTEILTILKPPFPNPFN